MGENPTTSLRRAACAEARGRNETCGSVNEETSPDVVFSKRQNSRAYVGF